MPFFRSFVFSRMILLVYLFLIYAFATTGGFSLQLLGTTDSTTERFKALVTYHWIQQNQAAFNIRLHQSSGKRH